MGFSPRGSGEVVAIGATVVCVAYFVAVWISLPWVAGDTPFVLDGSNAFLHCLSNGDYHACGFTGKLNYWGLMSPIGDWPLLQHIPDLISIELGANGHPARTMILEGTERRRRPAGPPPLLGGRPPLVASAGHS